MCPFPTLNFQYDNLYESIIGVIYFNPYWKKNKITSSENLNFFNVFLKLNLLLHILKLNFWLLRFFLTFYVIGELYACWGQSHATFWLRLSFSLLNTRRTYCHNFFSWLRGFSLINLYKNKALFRAYQYFGKKFKRVRCGVKLRRWARANQSALPYC